MKTAPRFTSSSHAHPDPATPDTPAATTALTRRRLVAGAGLTAAALTATGLATAGADASTRSTTSRSGPARLTMSANGMLRRSGTNFRTGGMNAFQLVTNDYPSPRLMSHAEIDSLLDKAVAMNAGVVRAHTLGASVGQPFTLVRGVSGSGSNPTVRYDQAVWDVIDHAVYAAGQRGLYLIAPLVDELGYYHGGKRHWVNFRRPGSVSLDSSVKAANFSAQRAGENAFYTDRQINWDFEQYVRDWLQHVNPLTGIAFKDDPVLSIVQVGNELWTAAQDAPGWVAGKAAVIKDVAPDVLVMDSGTDGLAVESMAWASRYVDILETHPYSTFDADDVVRMATFAASKGKAFAVGEYAWSKPSAPDIEDAVRRTGNVSFSAPWSLQNGADRHDQGAPLGGDDVSLYVPGEDDAQRTQVTRIYNHGRRMILNAPAATYPTS